MRSRSGETDDSEPGQFLRARRAALDPRRAGPAPGDGVRRVAGLRREELAQLAHLGFDYVVRLEQGRTRRRQLTVDTNRDQFMATLTGHDTESRAALRFLLQWSSATDRTEFPREARNGRRD